MHACMHVCMYVCKYSNGMFHGYDGNMCVYIYVCVT